MITVQELIKKLEKLPLQSIVVMSKDSEGNEFSPLVQIEDLYYIPENDWSGEIDYKPSDKSQKCIVLWPTN